MKKVLILQFDRDIKKQKIKDGNLSFINEIIKSLEKRGYFVEFINATTMNDVGSYIELPIFEKRMNQSKDFARQIKKELFEPYDLVLIIHPIVGLFLNKENLPPIEKTIVFPMLLGKEYEYYEDVPKKYIDLEKKFFKNKYLIQSPSVVHANVLENCYGVDKQNILVYPRGFSQDIFTPKERYLRDDISEEKPLRVFYANAIRPQKGCMHLIDLAKECKKNKVPINIVMYGDPRKTEYTANFLKQASHPDIRDSFLIQRSIDQKLLGQEMLKADVAIVPSVYESFGKAVLECSGSGLPTIVFNDVDVYREFVDDSCVVFSDRDETSLFTHLQTLVSDPNYYHSLSINGIENGKKYFASEVYDVTVEKLLNVLEKHNKE